MSLSTAPGSHHWKDTPAPARTGTAAVFTALCWIQGLYFLLTGLWPLVSLDTFLMVTGPKTDLWLVQTVGVLITAVAVVLLVAAGRRRPNLEVGLLAVATALALGGVDMVFVAQGVIPPVYLVDAAVEAFLLAGWSGVLFLGARSGE